MVSGHSPSCPLMAIVSSVVESSIDGNDNIKEGETKINKLRPVSENANSSGIPNSMPELLPRPCHIFRNT